MTAGLAVAVALEGMPFRQAHALVGSIVAEAQRTGRALPEVVAARLAEAAPAVAARLEALFDPAGAVALRRLRGGTAPEAVRASLAAALDRVRGS
jgi:argininosuccinate lyase